MQDAAKAVDRSPAKVVKVAAATVTANPEAGVAVVRAAVVNAASVANQVPNAAMSATRSGLSVVTVMDKPETVRTPTDRLIKQKRPRRTDTQAMPV